jgi:hypothetical protein
MSSSDIFMQPIWYWLFMTDICWDGILIAARLFIKDDVIEKKRMFLFYCVTGAAALFLFFLSRIGLKLQDSASWVLVQDLSAAVTVIAGFFIYYTYPELWAQKPKGKRK